MMNVMAEYRRQESFVGLGPGITVIVYVGNWNNSFMAPTSLTICNTMGLRKDYSTCEEGT